MENINTVDVWEIVPVNSAFVTHHLNSTKHGTIALLTNPSNEILNKLLKKSPIMKEIKTKSYTIYDNEGNWLGQIILSSDGMFCSVTDYGNLSYAWRSFGDDDFRKFITQLNTGYFGTKMYTGMAYILYGKKCEKACDRFAEKILPALQKELKKDLEVNPEWG